MQSSICFDVNLPSYRGVEQLVARRAHNPKVVGSSPAPATKTIKRLYFYTVHEFLLFIAFFYPISFPIRQSII